MSKLDPAHLFDVPLHVVVVEGAVVVTGPDAVAISMTPNAAEASARLLREAAEEARRSPGPDAPTLPIDQE
jgi:hypothetical protein